MCAADGEARKRGGGTDRQWSYLRLAHARNQTPAISAACCVETATPQLTRPDGLKRKIVRDNCRSHATNRCAVSKLPIGIQSPAECHSARRKPARVGDARGKTREFETAIHRGWQQMDAVGNRDPKLSLEVRPPTVGHLRRRDSTAMRQAGRKMSPSQITRRLNRA